MRVVNNPIGMRVRKSVLCHVSRGIGLDYSTGGVDETRLLLESGALRIGCHERKSVLSPAEGKSVNGEKSEEWPNPPKALV